jgi:hypothetical protein
MEAKVTTTRRKAKIKGCATILTRNSTYWIVPPDDENEKARYCRLPNEEGSERPVYSEAMEYGIWHDLEALYIRDDGDGMFAQIIPTGRGADAEGLHTSLIVGIENFNNLDFSPS